MATFAIEIHDAGIELTRDGECVAREPGFAWISGNTVVTGHAARGQARLLPRQVFSDFWGALATDRIADPRAQARSAADLAYAQLTALWQPHAEADDDAVLIVPSDMDRAQLSLLLGIAQAASLPVRALVPTALASATRAHPECQLVHLDAGLHRSLTVELDQRHGAAEAGFARHLRGLEALRETWLRHVTTRFIEGTRFDPSYSAASEQALYDQLPEWVAALEHEAAIKIVLESQGAPVQIELARSELVRVAEPHYQEWRRAVSAARAPGRRLVILLAPHLAHLPGLIDALLEMDAVEVVPIARGRAAANAIAHAQAGGGAEAATQVLTRVPWRDASAAEPEAVRAGTQRTAVRSAATHVVFEGMAHAIGPRGLVLGSEPESGRPHLRLPNAGGISRRHCDLVVQGRELVLRDDSRYGSFVNGQRVSGEVTLRPGDRLRLGTPGVELLVIGLAQEGS